MTKRCSIELPDFELLKRQPKPPHVARVVAQREIPNEYGTPVKFTVRESRSGKEWWIYASLQGERMSNTLHTSKAEKAQQWIAAVKTGAVCIKPRRLI